MEQEALPTLLDRGYWRGEAVGKRADGSRFHQATLTALDDGIVCLVHDITERKAQGHQLKALNEVGRELMSAETLDDIARIGVEAVENELGSEFTCVRRLDHAVNRLEYIALTDGAEDLLEKQTAYNLDARWLHVLKLPWSRRTSHPDSHRSPKFLTGFRRIELVERATKKEFI